MRRLLLAACAASSLCTPVLADEQPPAMHDKRWYLDHPAVRRATIRFCVGDNSNAHLYDCQNAADGETMAWGNAQAARSGLADEMRNPQWWMKNSYARHGAAIVCMRGGGGSYPYTAPYCPVILATEIKART